MKAHRPAKLTKLSKRHKTVNRIYGGHLDHKVVRERIVRAFLIEEQKIVKKVSVPQAFLSLIIPLKIYLFSSI